MVMAVSIANISLEADSSAAELESWGPLQPDSNMVHKHNGISNFFMRHLLAVSKN